MMLERRNLVLGGVLVTLLALELVLREPDVTDGLDGPFFADFRRDDVQRLVIATESDALALSRTESGWGLEELDNFPVVPAAVDRILVRLAGLRERDVVSRDASSHESLGVGERPPRRIRVEGEGGVVLLDLLQGETDPGSSFLRASGTDDVVRATGLALVSTEPSSFWDTRLVQVDPSALRGVTLTVADAAARLELERGSAGRWETGEGTVSVAGAEVDRLLRAANGSYGADVVLGAPTGEVLLDVRFVLEGGESSGLRLVATAEQIWATNPVLGEAWSLALPGAAVQRLLDAARAIVSAAR